MTEKKNQEDAVIRKRDYTQLVKEDVPWLERSTVSSGSGISVGTLTLENGNCYKCFQAPYTDETAKLKERAAQKEGQRLLFVSDDMNLARKTAVLFCVMKYKGVTIPYTATDVWDLDDSDFEFDFPVEFIDGDDDEEKSYTVWHIDYSAVSADHEIPANRYMAMGDFVISMKGDEPGAVIVEGISQTVELMQKEAISALSAETVIVIVSEQMAKSSKMDDLVFQYGFTRIRLGNVPDDYYRNYFERLIGDDLSPLTKAAYLELFRELKERRRENLDEETMALALKEFEEAGVQEAKGKRSAHDRLEKMTGLGEFKTVARELVALGAEATRNPKLKQLNRSMIFAGNPGTGKSTCANLLAELALEKNAGSGVFVSAHRSDMIGKYVGHTAPMIHALFNRARGGILLIDEAGFLIQTGTGDYVKEALKELVRYMELYPDVTVIFAMYPRECKAFLKMDEGLSSRISRVVMFRDYRDEELLEIFRNMASEQGYETENAAMEQVSAFIGKLRTGAGDSFGNAREMRKLLVQAINSISLRHLEEADSLEKNRKNRKNRKGQIEMVLTAEDILFAAERILPKRISSGSFGFRTVTKQVETSPGTDRNVIAASASA